MVFENIGKNNGGQAVIEFILGLLIVISFFFFYVRLSAVFAISNYIQYATFMSARTLASSAKDQMVQEENAKQVLQSMVSGKFKGLIQAKSGDGMFVGDGNYFTSLGPIEEWNHGASYQFSAKLSFYPFSANDQAVMLDLTSESWMPRERSEDECQKAKARIEAMTGVQNVKVEWDNGC